MILGLLVTGCGETYPPPMPPEKTNPNESTPTTNTNRADGTTVKPVKELTLEEKLVGTYEIKGLIKGEEVTFKRDLFGNGKVVSFKNGEREGIGMWEIVGKEVHIGGEDEESKRIVAVYKVEADGGLTTIAEISNGQRKDYPKERHFTFKKIK